MCNWTKISRDLTTYIESVGVDVRSEKLGFETTGTFDGISLTTNIDCDWETRCHNMAHSLGHIVQWSLDPVKFETLYADLRVAKASQPIDVAAIEKILTRFRDYEVEASEYAVWLLTEIGHADVIPRFTNFARADIEAIIGYHRDGIAPIWEDFYRAWNERVATGGQPVESFALKPIPKFTPVRIVEKRVIREVDGIQ